MPCGGGHDLSGRLDEGLVIVGMEKYMHFLPFQEVRRRDQPVGIAMALALKQIDADEQLELAERLAQTMPSSAGGDRVAATQDECADLSFARGQNLIGQFGQAMS